MSTTGPSRLTLSALDTLRGEFGERLQENVSLARFTSARVGGPARALVVVNSAGELSETAFKLWKLELPFYILGGGSNVLISDRGIGQVVVMNRARAVRFELDADPPMVWAESGAGFGLVARQAAGRGLAGLEWATGIPGTVGGAVIGNAGAHGGDMDGNLIVAEILHRYKSQPGSLNRHGAQSVVHEQWPVEKMEYQYRSSLFKKEPGLVVVLSALLKLERVPLDEVNAIQDRIATFTEHRRRTQPPGASMGSMFKNPPGDFAGRLIDGAGLKGARVGGAEISTLHGNFFINKGQATAADIRALMQKAQESVEQQFGISLEPEIELVGDWDE